MKVLGVCRVGKNCFKMRLEELGGILEGEVAICRMIVSFSPTMFQLSFLQRIKQCVFGQFLKSMRDFSREGRIPFEDPIQNGNDAEGDEESGVRGPDYVQLLEELFGSLCREDDSDSTSTLSFLCPFYASLHHSFHFPLLAICPEFYITTYLPCNFLNFWQYFVENKSEV